jgi:hypothetical protein
MYYKLVITNEYLDTEQNRIFDVEKRNGEKVDLYNELICYLPRVEVSKIPQLLDLVIQEAGESFDESGWHFGPITEGEKIWVEKGFVEFYVTGYNISYPNRVVFNMALEIARKSLEAVNNLQLKEKGLVDDTWIKKVKDSIPKLDAKLDAG